jgi:hypothetical protein
MLIACIGYVSSGVLLYLHSVIADIGDNGPPPPLVNSDRWTENTARKVLIIKNINS